MPRRLLQRLGGASGGRVECNRTGLLRQLFASSIGNHRYVQVSRLRQGEPLLQINLPRRRADQIRTAHHVRDALLCVVDDNRKLIRPQAIRPQQNEIAGFGCEILLHCAGRAVRETDSRVTNPQAPGTRLTPGGEAVAASSWIHGCINTGVSA